MVAVQANQGRNHARDHPCQCRAGRQPHRPEVDWRTTRCGRGGGLHPGSESPMNYLAVTGVATRVARRSAEQRSNLLLVLVCLAQFMVILDVSIVNVALPSIRNDLHFSTT